MTILGVGIVRRNSMSEPKCKACVHSIFDELWGEYKCRKRECVIYYPEFFNGCEYYEERK